MHRDAVRRAWDAVADDYAAKRRADGEDAALIEDLLADLPADARVLDVGCGDGQRTLTNLVGAADALGLDFSRRQLELARGAAPDARLVQADMTALPVADGAVDAITAYHAVFHVSRSQHPAVYEEFARVLAPGGRLLMTVGAGRSDATRRNWLDSGHAMYWSTPGRRATVSQLDEAGFDVVWERFVDDPLGSQALFVLAERRP
ncbi:class I SAM-dependent methyltransferase [Halogranum gelatinilyticum]|nr:class I SAM-dependent methyltransferase [Halogranum gelatinilyticum]